MIEEVKTQRKRKRTMPCVDGGRGWIFEVISQRMSGSTVRWKDRGRILPYSLQGDQCPAHILV